MKLSLDLRAYTNQIILGDSLEILRKVPDKSVDLHFFSPPYNCRKLYDVFSDELPWPEYYAWMEKILVECYRTLVDGGTVAVNIPSVVKWQSQHKYASSWRDYDPNYKYHRGSEKCQGRGRLEPLSYRFFGMMMAIDPHIREPIIWVKGTEEVAIAVSRQYGCDSDPLFRSSYEVILLGSKNQWYHSGGTGRRGTDVFSCLDATKDVWFISPTRNSEHPASFPAELPKRVISFFVHKKDALICDPFCGTGTTCVEAKKLGFNYLGIDNSPKYVGIASNAVACVSAKLEQFLGE